MILNKNVKKYIVNKNNLQYVNFVGNYLLENNIVYRIDINTDEWLKNAFNSGFVGVYKYQVIEKLKRLDFTSLNESESKILEHYLKTIEYNTSKEIVDYWIDYLTETEFSNCTIKNTIYDIFFRY